jgi:3-oxoacyl-ACP reductase-like protein
MSVFGSIVSAIFGSKHAAGVTTAAAPSSAPPSSTGTSSSPAAPAAPSAKASPAAASPSTAAPTAAPGAAAAKPISRADVEAILKKMSDDQREHLDWKTSIVDLMKLLKLDSGLGARKQLAQELGYTGALDGSAEMNVWLHKQVMVKLAESGGQVPQSLRA